MLLLASFQLQVRDNCLTKIALYFLLFFQLNLVRGNTVQNLEE